MEESTKNKEENQEMLRGAGRALNGARSLSSKVGDGVKVLTVDKMSPQIRNAEYAVRGELPIKAEKYKLDLANGAKLPFDEVIYCNIGNPQQLGQKPITFFRQVSALLDCPDLLDENKRKDVLKLFPADAISRALTLKKAIGSLGAYSHSQGIPHVRENVAKFIQERDGYPSNPDHIFLTAGASEGVKACLSAVIGNPDVGILIPIPQYPLYSASLTMLGGQAVPYYLDEEDNWSLSVNDLNQAVIAARQKKIDVRGLVVINPGNPTGQCLSPDNMTEIVQFCAEQKVVLMADEVYQTNVYNPTHKFHSFKKILSSSKYADSVELFSFHSISKGMIGECGRRGGYFECTNIDEGVRQQLYKLASVSLCPSTHGQVLVDLMTNPPKKGDESYELYTQEISSIYDSLKRRSQKLVKAFNNLEGMTCNEAQGAMYTFPKITIPKKAVEEAKAAGKAPDVFYCLALLDATGVCVVPGSGFGQKEGTWHFRATFLPPEEKFDSFIQRISTFHQDFMNKYK